MYEKANRYLKFYYDNAKSKLPFSSYDEFVQHYRVDKFLLENYGEKVVHDDFLKFFDKALEYSSDNDAKQAMLSLAKNTQNGKTPSSQSFYDSLSGQVESFSFEDGLEVIKETGKDLGKVAVAGAGLFLLKVGATALVGYYLKKYLDK
tara:strand:+ start:19551 stop:19994 length:444 start_codon:yes stop_codon:yes gene_type:complete